MATAWNRTSSVLRDVVMFSCFHAPGEKVRSDSFEKLDPALEAGELVSIRDWFRSLADDRLPRWAHLTFTEPCLGFEFLARDAAGVRFAVDLRAELRPQFRLRQLSAATEQWVVVFHFDAERLALVADAVDGLVAEFPVRSRDD